MGGPPNGGGLGNGTAVKGGRFVGMRVSHGFLVRTYSMMI